MHVLHLVHSFPPTSFGGTERYVASIAHELTRHGVASTIFTVGGQTEPDVATETHDGLRVLRVSRTSLAHHTPIGLNAFARGVLERTLRSLRPDVVHIHHWHGLTTDAAATARAAGIPSVITLHDYFSTCPRFHRVRDATRRCAAETPLDECIDCVGTLLEAPADYLAARFGERRGTFRHEFNLAHAVLTLSDWQTDYLGRIPELHGCTFQTLPPPSPLPNPASFAHPPTRAPGDPVRLVSWGGLDPGKGLDDLVAACEQSDHAARFEIHHHGRVLDPAYAERLASLARTTRLELHGPFDDDAIATRFARYDAAVFPSRYMETYGMVVDEAMAVGLPVVVPDVGAPQERVGGRGLVYRADDVRALTACLDRLHAPGKLDRLRAASPGAIVRAEDHCRALASIYAAATGADESTDGRP